MPGEHTPPSGLIVDWRVGLALVLAGLLLALLIGSARSIGVVISCLGLFELMVAAIAATIKKSGS